MRIAPRQGRRERPQSEVRIQKSSLTFHLLRGILLRLAGPTPFPLARLHEILTMRTRDRDSGWRLFMRTAYSTKLGSLIHGTAEEALDSQLLRRRRGKVDLIFTSPPFPLNRKKKYGNLQGEEYIKWLADFALKLKPLLKPRGSVVMEVGNAWEPGRPVMSTLALRALLAFLDRGKFYLCQQFIYHNPARLPGPAQWVTIERIRVKDSYSHLWWMSPTDRPKATNRRILQPYSGSMRKLLETQRYNAGPRPSEHHVGKTSFRACRFCWV